MMACANRLNKFFFTALLFIVSPANAQPKKKYSNLKAVIQAASLAKDKKAENEALDDLANQNVEDRSDVMMLYGAIKDAETKAGAADSPDESRARINKIAKPFEKTTDPKHHDAIAELLGKEGDSLPNDFRPIYDTGTSRDDTRAAARLARVAILINAAGAGKNERALPALRRISKKGGVPGELADRAIAQIGKDEDLDGAIKEIRRHPKSHLNLTRYGAKAIDRIMREVDSPNLDDEARAALIARLGQATGPGAVPQYKALLTHRNPKVVEQASYALKKSMSVSDEPVALEMLASPTPGVRFDGLAALDEKMWSDKHAAKTIELLKSDPSPKVRAQAANILGKRKIKSAEPELKAALNDSSSWVRSAAQGALSEVNGENDQQIQKIIDQVKNKKK